MLSTKIFIFLFYVVLFEYYFGCASPATYYEITKENKNSVNDVLKEDTGIKQYNKKYDIDTEDKDDDEDEYEDDYKCVPKTSRCTCKCTKHKIFDCDECIVLRESSIATCTPGDEIRFYCPLCKCDEEGRNVCEDCFQKRINVNENIGNNIYRKKRAADSFYDYLYNDPLPLSTEQIRELQRQAYQQKRQEIIDKRREKQELAQQQAELARQNAEMRKELELQRRLDEEQRALDAQQDYAGDYVYEDTDNQEQDDYFTKKRSEKKNPY